MTKSTFDKNLGDWSTWHDPGARMRIGVSACLMGEEVRFDAEQSRNAFVADVLGERVECVPVCPEVAVGMEIPRPKIRLVEDEGRLRLVAPSTDQESTDRMNSYAEKQVRELIKTGLDGYIFKKASPSCGMGHVKVYESGRSDGRVTRRDGVGLYAAVLMARCPNLPVEEDGRLNDPAIRENFIERIFCRNRWRTLVHSGLTRHRLVAFHTAHKLLLRSHNEAGYRWLGALVGSAGRVPDRELYASYEAELGRVMQARATKKRHVNVLQHAMGYLKKQLTSGEKKEILTAIDDFGAGLLPLIVPLTLLRFNIRRYDIEYLMGQLYFSPHPKELMLRNHV